MKSFTLSTLFALVIFMCGCTKNKTATNTEGSFTVLTYNVAGLPEGFNADQHPTRHMWQISPLLNDYDVVNVQEDFNYHHLLIKDEHHPYRSNFMAPVPFGDGLNMFSNYPFTGFKRTKWNSCLGTDCLTPKGFTFCTLELSAGVYVDLYNVHCNAGSDTADLIARRSNILQLCAYIKTHSKTNAVIIMGDTNCRYTRLGDNMEEVVNIGFTDVWVELCRDGVYPLHNGIAMTDCGSDLKHPTCEVVDKILYRSSSKVTLKPVEFEIQQEKFTTTDGEWMSDHRPLYSKFNYTVNL